MTPIIRASLRGNLEVVKYLRSRGANMEAVTEVRLMKFDVLFVGWSEYFNNCSLLWTGRGGQISVPSM